MYISIPPPKKFELLEGNEVLKRFRAASSCLMWIHPVPLRR